MKTKELLSLPVGKYICTDGGCSYLYLLDVQYLSGIGVIFDVSKLEDLYFYPHTLFTLQYKPIDSHNLHKGYTWKAMCKLQGLLAQSHFAEDVVEELHLMRKIDNHLDLTVDLKPFLIERICNSSNGDYRKRFLQDKLKQIIKNEKKD